MASRFETLISEKLLKGMYVLGMFDTGHASDSHHIARTSIVVTDEQKGHRLAKYVSGETNQAVVEHYDGKKHGLLTDWRKKGQNMPEVTVVQRSKKAVHSHDKGVNNLDGVGYEVVRK